jgi:hypothetical protein
MMRRFLRLFDASGHTERSRVAAVNETAVRLLQTRLGHEALKSSRAAMISIMADLAAT